MIIEGTRLTDSDLERVLYRCQDGTATAAEERRLAVWMLAVLRREARRRGAVDDEIDDLALAAFARVWEALRDKRCRF